MLIDFAVSLAVFLILYFILLKSSRLLLKNLSRFKYELITDNLRVRKAYTQYRIPEKVKDFAAS